MNFLERLYDTVTYPLVKWWFTRKYKRFLNPQEFKAVIQYYDVIYREEVEELSHE